MRKMILYFTLILSSFYVSAQPKPGINFSGKVTDALTGDLLPGASIYFTDARLGTMTNGDGNFILRKVPSGHHLIEVSHAGYNTIVEHIDLLKDTVKDFSLTSAVIENQGVTVTGVTTATSTRNTPTPITLIRRTHLLQTPSTNIIDALSKQAGMAQISTGPAIAKPVIRGLGYNRVVVINDGVRQEGQQWGDEHGIEIDELSVNRAEILKGPASLIYGSDAIAGVINFLTSVPVADKTIKGNIYSNYQTNNGLVGLNGNLSGNYNGFNWNAYGSYKSAKDYKNKYDGKVLNSRFNERNFGGYIGLNKSWGYSHLIFSNFDQNLGLIEGDRDDATGKFLANAGSPIERIASKKDLESRKLFTPNQHIQHYKLASENSVRIGKNRLKLNFGYQNNLREEFGNPLDLSETELAFDLKTLSYNLQWRFPESKDFETTVGLSGMYQANKNNGEEVIIPVYDLFDIGAFLFVQKLFANLAISGGLRFDNRAIDSEEFMEGSEIKFPSFTKTFSNISGSAGLSFHPSQTVSLKANVARGFRSPALSELASNGAHEGTNRYEYGDQSLESEKSFQLDAGLELNYNHFDLTFSGFHNRVSDFIFYRRLTNRAGMDSIVNSGGEELGAFKYSQNNARLYGLELTTDLHPHPFDWIHFQNTVSLIRGRFDEEVDRSNNLPMIPPARWISELRINFNKAKRSFRNFYAKLEMDKTFKQNKPFIGFNTETSTSAYTLLNAGAGKDIFVKDRIIFSLHIAANNITDEGYQNHLSRLKYSAVNNVTGRRGVFNTGRNFSFKLNIPLSFTIDR
ncbi:MAG: TonB-dependent receptor [Bacteroidota bacterium]|nr:TonB-dependent receptor [Bacteroidota bacterium]